MLCIYHIADHDGKGSAAIVRSVYPEAEFLGINHDMKIPYEQIEKHDKIVICDYALPVDYMFELNKTRDVTWIDHHASVIEEYEQKMQTGKYALRVSAGLKQRQLFCAGNIIIRIVRCRKA